MIAFQTRRGITGRNALLAATTALLGACTLFGPHTPAQNPDPNHTHADFAVWIEGKKLDFSADEHMSGSSSHEHLHLHDGVGHVIHRHKPGLTFGTFLASLGMNMTEQCLTLESGVPICPDDAQRWRMYVNGNEVPMNPDDVFSDLDKILLTYGASAEQVKEQLQRLTDDACLYSQTCPWRGKPPVENCVADPEVPCVLPPE